MVHLGSNAEIEPHKTHVDFQVCFSCMMDIKKYTLGKDTPTDAEVNAAQDEYEFNRLMQCTGLDEIGKFPPGQTPTFIGKSPKKKDN